MKKLFFTTAIVAVLAMSISSCRPCQVCTKANSPELRVCEKDYGNNTQYGIVVDGYQTQGYNCKSAI